MSPAKTSRRARALLFGVALGLVAFELAMQGVAWVAWRRSGGFSVQAAHGPHVVLCVGDSFTFGLGATPGHDYPQLVEGTLRATIPDAVVRNGGKPGRDSAGVLRNLSQQLDAVAPRVVYVLVGYNDRHSHPQQVREDELSAASADAGFPLRSRTFDLLLRLAQSLFGDDPGRATPAAPSRTAILGAWHSGDFEIEFATDGGMRIGGRESRFSLDGAHLRFELEPGVPIEAEATIVDDALSLSSAALGPEPLRFARGKAEGQAAARAALDRADLAAAAVAIDALLAARPEEPAAIALRAELSLRRGDPDAAARDLDRLRERSGEGETVLTARVDALMRTGATAEAVDLACEWLATHPSDSPLWWILSRHAAADRTHHDRILAALQSALALERPGDPWRAGLLRLRAGILIAAAAPAARILASSLGAALVDGDKSQVVSWLQGSGCSRADFEVAMAEAAPDLAARARCESWWKDAQEGFAAPAAVLGRHLRMMDALCRARGAQLVVLSYPEDLGELGRAIHDVAGDGIPLIDCQADFREALRIAPREHWFVEDGHCNDAGYARIAALVATDALVRLR